MTASEPTTCEACEGTFSDGIHEFVRMRLKSFPHVEELHALILALEKERDWLKADMVVMTTELTTAEKDRVMLLAVIDRVKALADEYANDPAKYYREMGHTADYYWQEGCVEAAKRIRAALAGEGKA